MTTQYQRERELFKRDLNGAMFAIGLLFGPARKTAPNTYEWSAEPENVIDVDGRVVETQLLELPAGDDS